MVSEIGFEPATSSVSTTFPPFVDVRRRHPEHQPLPRRSPTSARIRARCHSVGHSRIDGCPRLELCHRTRVTSQRPDRATPVAQRVTHTAIMARANCCDRWHGDARAGRTNSAEVGPRSRKSRWRRIDRFGAVKLPLRRDADEGSPLGELLVGHVPCRVRLFGLASIKSSPLLSGGS